MTYGQFLLLFLVLPSGLLAYRIRRQLGRRNRLSLLILMGLALVYTTPWDNHLVATGIWWYDPAKVLGATLGWVPLEEYAFFLLQPLFVGLLYLNLASMPSIGAAGQGASSGRGWALRLGTTSGLAILWIAAVLLLLMPDGRSSRYLALELAWALPPLMLQAGFGADLIAERLRLVGPAFVLATLYLVAADAVAITTGIWTIDPEQTLGWDPFPGFVFEEAVFFALTNSLVLGGLSLLLHRQSYPRLRSIWRRWKIGWAGRLFPAD